MKQLTKNTVPPPQECGVLFSNSCFFATRIPVYATSRTQPPYLWEQFRRWGCQWYG